MVLALITAGIAFALLGYASHSLQLTRRALDFQRAHAAAEAGLDYGVVCLLDTMRTNKFSLSRTALQTLLDNLPGPPSFGSYAYVSPNGSNSFHISVDTPTQTGTITQGFAAQGSDGQFQYFTIVCGAWNPATGVGAVVKETAQAISVFFSRYAVFYEEDMDIFPGPQMDMYGPVHCNSDIYIDGAIDFHNRVTANGNIFHSWKYDGSTTGGAYIEDGSSTMNSMMQGLQPMDSRHSDWMTESLNLWDGRVLDRAHAMPYLSSPYSPLSDAHDLIEPPLDPSDPGYQADTEAAKFANNAALMIHVDTAGTFTATNFLGVDVSARFSPATLIDDGDYLGVPMQRKNVYEEYEMSTTGSYETARTFWDARENTTMAAVDLFVEDLLAAFPELTDGTFTASQGSSVLYVTRQDPDGVGGLVPAVRLRNARELSAAGLSIASDLPVYIEGEYNVKNGVKRAMVAGDAVTLLSEDWQDARSSASLSNRIGDDTAYNAVIFTGNDPTIPGVSYNGGLDNVLRLLEDWTGEPLTFRGSIIDLWVSEVAVGLWSGSYYDAPIRDWGYDNQYLTSAPPGVPQVFAVEQLNWGQSTWADEGW